MKIVVDDLGWCWASAYYEKDKVVIILFWKGKFTLFFIKIRDKVKENLII